MKKLYFLFVFLITNVFFCCSPDVVTVQVIRNPSIKFNLNGASWKSDKYSFAAPSMVVVYPDDPTQSAKQYTRMVLQASGSDDKNNNLQLIISFDVADANQLVGTYTPAHNLQRGLAQVQLFNVSNSNNLEAHELCDDNTVTSSFQIQKQSSTERLITGIFQITLCNIRDTTQKITLTNGILTDIRY